MGLFYTLAQRVGVPRAKRMITLAEVVQSTEAERIGIVDRLGWAGACGGDGDREAIRRCRATADGAHQGSLRQGLHDTG